MVAEMLQKYFFIFNVFLKKLYIFIFNEKKMLYFKENIFVFNKNIFALKNFYFHPGFFYIKIYIFIQSKINVFNEIFLFNGFWQSRLPFVSEMA